MSCTCGHYEDEHEDDGEGKCKKCGCVEFEREYD
jgi:hypothetical protein